MDVAGNIAARNDIVHLRSVRKQSLVAATVVRHRPGRRLDIIPGIATESDRSTNDLLAAATAARIWGDNIFRHLLLSWQRRGIPKPRLAVERRSRDQSVYEPIPAGDACAMDNRF